MKGRRLSNNLYAMEGAVVECKDGAMAASCDDDDYVFKLWHARRDEAIFSRERKFLKRRGIARVNHVCLASNIECSLLTM